MIPSFAAESAKQSLQHRPALCLECTRRHENVKRLFFILTSLLLVTIAGSSHSVPSSTIRPSITLPLETTESNGSIPHQSLNIDEIDRLEETLDTIVERTQAKGISAAVGIPDKGMWHSTRGITGNETRIRISPDLRFYAGSIGKIYTSGDHSSIDRSVDDYVWKAGFPVGFQICLKQRRLQLIISLPIHRVS